MAGKKKNRRRKGKFSLSPPLLLPIFAVVLLAVLLLRLLPVRGVVLRAQNVEYTEKARIYAFRDEEYTTFTTTDTLSFNLKEGEIASAYTVLADGYKIRSTKFLQEKIEALEFMINNPRIASKTDLYELIIPAQARLNEIEDELSASSEPGAIELLTKETAELKEYIQMLKRCMQYIITPVSVLESLKWQNELKLSETSFPLTLYNLNFSVFGYIYYHLDGYEDEMNFDSLTLRKDDTLFDYLDHFSPSVKEPSETECVIRSVAADRAILAVRVHSSVYVKSEQSILERRDQIVSAYNVGAAGEYYSFLYSRPDILESYPELTVSLPSGKSISACAVDVIETENDRIYILLLRSNVEDVQNLRIDAGRLTTQSVRAYRVPESAIVEHGGKTYVTILSSGIMRSMAEVTVYDILDGYAILRTADNDELSSGMEVAVKGEYVQ